MYMSYCNFVYELLQLFGTFGADSLVIELLLLYNVAFYYFFAFQFWGLLAEEVDNLTAFLAVEMYMAFYIAIVADAVVVDGYHLCSPFLAQHAKCIIYSGTTQGWHLVAQCLVHVIYRRMDGMVDKIIHDGKPLYRRANTFLHQSGVCFCLFHALTLSFVLRVQRYKLYL